MKQHMLIGLALGALLALGCGDSTSAQQDAGPAQDSAPVPDANPGRDAPEGCGFAAIYDTLAFVSTDIGTDSSYDPSNYVFFDGFLNQDATPDVLEIELVNGYGVFADGFKPGTFTLAGDEVDYGTCGLCVRLLSRVDPATWEASQYYMATGGSVTLTSVHPHVSGTLNLVTFAHVDIDTTTLQSMQLDDGCTSQATSVSFDAELETPDGGFPEDTDGGVDGQHM
jgi:hypothetical protein